MKFAYKKFSVVMSMLLLMSACTKESKSPVEESKDSQEHSTNIQEDKNIDTLNKSNNEVIKFFHRWPQDPKKTYFDERVHEFTIKNPDVTINVESVINDSYKEKIRVMVSSSNIPDIFTSWSDSFAQNLVSSNKIKSLNEVISSDKGWSDGILQSQFKGFTFNDKIYGVPLTVDGKSFFYNKDIFSKEGIAVPKTWKEFITALDKLKEKGYETPLIAGLSDPWVISHYLGPIFDRVVPKEVLAKDYNESTGQFTDEHYIEGLKMFKKLTDYMGEISSSLSHEESRNKFIEGNQPIIFLQLAEIRMLEDGNVNFEYGYFNFPEVEGAKGEQNTLEGAPEGYMLSESAGDKTVEFLKFLTSKESAEKFTKDSGELTAIIGAVNENTASKNSIEAFNLITSAASMTPWFDNAVNINIGDIFMRGGQSLAIGETTEEEIMKEVIAKAKEISKQ